MLIKTKYSSENIKLRHFGKNMAKTRHSRHLTKIMVSVSIGTADNHGNTENHGFRDFRVSVIICCP